MQTPITLLQATIASFVVSSGCIAFSDVVADGIVVQRTRDSADPKVAGGLQSLCWGSVSVTYSWNVTSLTRLIVFKQPVFVLLPISYHCRHRLVG